MDPRQEPEASVREGTRQVFRSLLPAARERSSCVAQRFRNEPEIHVEILLAAARLADRDDPESRENIALQRQNIGVDYLKLKRPADAVPYLQSLDYFVMKNAPGQVLESLILQLMDALLQSKQYDQAARVRRRA